jgi:hypothetical protein
MAPNSVRHIPAAVLAVALALGGPAAIAKPHPSKGLTGMWLIKATDYGRAEKPPFKPQAAAAAEAARKAVEDQGQVLSDAAKKCLPIGMPGFMSNEFALEILETPGRVTMISENSPLVRSIYLDRKTHTADAQPGWNGHSIGRWEGATLVIDTIDLNDRKSHIPHSQILSSQTHIVERLHLEAGGKTLVDEATFTDPTVLTGPYVKTTRFDRMPPGSELWEYACEVDAPGWSERYANDPAAKPKQ